MSPPCRYGLYNRLQSQKFKIVYPPVLCLFNSWDLTMGKELVAEISIRSATKLFAGPRILLNYGTDHPVINLF